MKKAVQEGKEVERKLLDEVQTLKEEKQNYEKEI